MKTVRRVADRVVMLYPLARLGQSESQILFDDAPSALATSADDRVRRFVA
jgi:phospholipid/cholesterol/gamma-HCH transport system ATP-binding protein